MGRRFLSDLTIFSLLLLAPLWQLNAFQTQGGFFGLGEFSRASTFSNYCFSTSSESPIAEWNKTYGWPYSGVRATSVQQTSDGGYVFAGGSGWLFKLGADGNVEWNKTYGGIAYDVRQTTDGGYVICGSDYHNGLIVKTDFTGNVEWNMTPANPCPKSGDEEDMLYSVKQTRDGGYIFCGSTFTYTSPYSADDQAWLVKINASGSLQWAKTFGGAGWTEIAYSVQQTDDDGYIIAAFTWAFGAGKTDFWLIKTDSDGNQEWSKTFGGSDYELAFSVQQTNDRGYIIAGYTTSLGTGGADFWLVKTNASGSMQWNKTYGGPYDDYAYSVQQTFDGGYIIAGSNFWLVKTDASGNVLWNQTYSGALYDEARSIQETIDGGYIVAGNTNSFGEQSGALLIKLVGLGPRTWTVDDDGPADFSKIQDAINAANPGDVIYVKVGTYYENIVVDKTVSLTGEKPAETIIDGETARVEIRANNVIIQNFTIRNSNQATDWSSNNLVSISNFNGTLIQGNVITSPDGKTAGIVVMDSYRNIISGNNITANYNEGIRLCHSSNNTVSGNNITGNSIDLDESSYNNTLTENIVSLAHIGCAGSFNIISRNSVTNSSHPGGGIALYRSSNTISENIITNNEWGVTLYGHGHNISGNTISASTYDGILVYSNDSRIYSNNITDNGQAGIEIEISCSNNEFYHNNLINNTRNVLTLALLGNPPMHNTWDDGYPSGGNYWSDYNGTDSNHDGIGDSNCTIDANNNDRYPLMGMFSDFGATSEYHVQSISNSSISSFQYGDSSIRFNVTGEDGTKGFCRICIPTALMNATYRVFVNGTEVSYSVLACSNSTHSYLYFTYSHSTKEIVIIPELASLIILPLFMMATLLAVIVYRKKCISTR